MHDIRLARSGTHELRKTFVNVDDVPQTHKFNPGTEFSYERHRCHSMTDVRDLLNELADDPHCAVVLGRPLNFRGERNLQTFEDALTTLWWIDLDGVPQLEEGVQATIERCLPFLVDHEYVYAFSQSAGLKEGLRCRVICETDGEFWPTSTHTPATTTACCARSRARRPNTSIPKSTQRATSSSRPVHASSALKTRIPFVHFSLRANKDRSNWTTCRHSSMWP